MFGKIVIGGLRGLPRERHPRLVALPLLHRPGGVDEREHARVGLDAGPGLDQRGLLDGARAGQVRHRAARHPRHSGTVAVRTGEPEPGGREGRPPVVVGQLLPQGAERVHCRLGGVRRGHERVVVSARSPPWAPTATTRPGFWRRSAATACSEVGKTAAWSVRGRREEVGLGGHGRVRPRQQGAPQGDPRGGAVTEGGRSAEQDQPAARRRLGVGQPHRDAAVAGGQRRTRRRRRAPVRPWRRSRRGRRRPTGWWPAVGPRAGPRPAWPPRTASTNTEASLTHARRRVLDRW